MVTAPSHCLLGNVKPGEKSPGLIFSVAPRFLFAIRRVGFAYEIAFAVPARSEMAGFGICWDRQK